MNREEYLADQLSKYNINITNDIIGKFIRFYELLIEKNKVMNLTAITDFEDVVIKHFCDSVSLCQFIDPDKNLSVADLGTGAGFPGIPLKICFPKLDITLIDSLNKRLKFLDEVIEELGLEKIRTVHSRAEDISHDKIYREGFDICVSRAVANLSTLSEYCLPLVKCGGKFISYKSGDIDEEASGAKKAVKILGGEISSIEKFELTDGISRSFVILDKISVTPKKYPRKAGTPSKEPL